MKQFFLFFIFYISVLLSTLCYGQEATTNNEGKRQVAVFVHCDKTVTSPTNALRAKLTSSLINEGYNSYVVLDRTDEILTALKTEYEYQSGGLVRDDQLVTIGEHLGIDLICFVNITYYEEDKQYFFECKLVNITSSQIESQSFYPSDDKIVSSLSPQVQVRVAGELSKAFYYNDKGMTIGSVYYDETNSPVYVDGFLMRIGYLDETGKHGFAFVVLPEMKDHPTKAKSDLKLQIPYISQLQLLYVNKDALGLDSEYWALDYEGKAPIYGDEVGSIDSLYKTLDFKDNTVHVRRSSGRVYPDGLVVSISDREFYWSHHGVKLQCINILNF